MPAKKSQALQTQEDQLPANVAMYEADAGKGFEEADKDSYAIPFLKLLQKMSPQVDENEGEYIKGAKAGMFWNTVTNRLYDTVQVVPVHYSRVFLEWVLRENGGGGFGGQYDVPTGLEMLATTERDDKNRDILPNGNELQDTRVHYVLILDDGNATPAMLSLARTQIKTSKGWMAQMDGLKMKRGDGTSFTPPMFSHVYQLSSVSKTKDGNTWSLVKVTGAGEGGAPLPVEETTVYNQCKSFREGVASGVAQTDFSQGEEKVVGGEKEGYSDVVEA